MSPVLLTYGLYAALAVALAGTLWRAAVWLRRRVGPASTSPPLGHRLRAAVAGAAKTLFSRRMPRLIVALLFDILLQGRLLRRDPVRWAAHLGVFLGFTGLLLLHALDNLTAEKLVKDYAPTLGPWLLLRDLFGAMALAGLAVGALRRRARRGTLPAPRRRDPLFVGLFVVVMASGFLLAAAKIVSARAFGRMAGEYSTAEGAELLPLRLYWAAHHGVAFDDLPAEPSARLLAAGKQLHEEGCASCHARPHAAFVSYPLSRALRPVARPMAAAGAERILIHLHVLACLLGLAYLPASRLFHVVADPVSLLARAGADPHPEAANRATRRAMARDACVRCGLCDERCSVRALAALFDNPAVLPSEKLLATGALDGTSPAELQSLAEGALACTDCGRCTLGCPVGLDLQDLWATGRADLVERGRPAAAVWVKAVPAAIWAERLEATPGGGIASATALTRDRRTFSPCVQCQTCTNVCPVVAHSVDSDQRVDLTPQKVMNLLRLGLVDLALGSRMVWDCATCYQCQEHCPAGIRVTDVLYELRNLAHARLAAVRWEGDRRGAAG